ncbi:hypothetical protein [Sphingomonas sp. 28-62-11]|uniref:hypothetical protein n=1 Tax=Sphingomonas sp. 28-62-11 TaxID=1970432 RepID=UPI000BD31724|nr:MAG: hypothetical protein B7Y49_00545 [Sphingomonas sp. 28-62-11]
MNNRYLLLRERPILSGLIWSMLTMAIILAFDAWFDTPKQFDHAGFEFVLLLIGGQVWAFWLRRHEDEVDTHAR